jgi:hypothetical protein
MKTQKLKQTVLGCASNLDHVTAGYPSFYTASAGSYIAACLLSSTLPSTRPSSLGFSFMSCAMVPAWHFNDYLDNEEMKKRNSLLNSAYIEKELKSSLSDDERNLLVSLLPL